LLEYKEEHHIFYHASKLVKLEHISRLTAITCSKPEAEILNTVALSVHSFVTQQKQQY
jgi:hypothetical protein